VGLVLAGVGLEEAHEYAIALILLIAGAVSVAFSAFHWKGIDDFPRITKIGRILICAFGVVLLPTSWIWIFNAKVDSPWSRLIGHKPESLARVLDKSGEPRKNDFYTKSEQPSKQPLRPNSLPIPKNKIETKEEQSEDRPYFSLHEHAGIKTSPGLRFTIDLINTGKRVAVDLDSRVIIIDQEFKKKPSLNDSSEANEIPPNSVSSHWTGLQSPSGDVIPAYFIFAIKYKDKEALKKGKLSQIWYFKMTTTWSSGMAPPDLLDAGVSERENIISHLRQELSDYLE
jgi:hypothetical protein